MFLSTLERKTLFSGDPGVILGNLENSGWQRRQGHPSSGSLILRKGDEELLLPMLKTMADYKRRMIQLVFTYAKAQDISTYQAIHQLVDGRDHTDIGDAPREVLLLLWFNDLGILFLGMRDSKSSSGVQIISPSFEIIPPQEVKPRDWDDWVTDLAAEHGLDGLDEFISITTENFTLTEPPNEWSLKEWSVVQEVPFLKRTPVVSGA